MYLVHASYTYLGQIYAGVQQKSDSLYSQIDHRQLTQDQHNSGWNLSVNISSYESIDGDKNCGAHESGLKAIIESFGKWQKDKTVTTATTVTAATVATRARIVNLAMWKT